MTKTIAFDNKFPMTDKDRKQPHAEPGLHQCEALDDGTQCVRRTASLVYRPGAPTWERAMLCAGHQLAYPEHVIEVDHDDENVRRANRMADAIGSALYGDNEER